MKIFCLEICASLTSFLGLDQCFSVSTSTDTFIFTPVLIVYCARLGTTLIRTYCCRWFCNRASSRLEVKTCMSHVSMHVHRPPLGQQWLPSGKFRGQSTCRESVTLKFRGIKRWCASDVSLPDVSVAYIGPKSTTRKTKIGTEVVHVIRDSDIILKVKRSKVNLQGRGNIVAT